MNIKESTIDDNSEIRKNSTYSDIAFPPEPVMKNKNALADFIEIAGKICVQKAGREIVLEFCFRTPGSGHCKHGVQQVIFAFLCREGDTKMHKTMKISTIVKKKKKKHEYSTVL